MKSHAQKIFSILLSVALLVGIFTMLPTTTKAAGTEVSRKQWLQALTQTFEMSVEEDNYPDNYFCDLSSDSEYYYDMLLAVEFGLVNIPSGEELRPDDPATREFAAQTLNFCLGYQLGENASYTFSEVSTVDHPDDIQIAIDRGWFALSGKSFLPNQPITAAEMESMLADAKTVLAKGTDGGSEDTYEFADHVVVIPQGSIAYENEQGQIVLEYNDVPLSVGDTFAVTTEIFPQTYTAAKIVTEGSKTVITVTEVPLAETLLSMHTSGSAVGDLADVEPAEGVDMVYVLEDNTRTRTIDESKPVKEVIFYREIGGLKVHVELTKLYVDYFVDAHGDNLDAVVTLRGDVYSSCTVPFGASVGDFSDVMDLCSVPIGGIGSFSAYMDISLDGSATAVYSAAFKGGVSYESGSGFRIIHSFQKKSFTINVEATLDASMNVSLSANKIPFISASCTATIGTKCLFNFDYRGEDATPKTCMHTDAWVYAHLRCYASVGYKKISKSYSDTLTLFNRNNSPLRSVTHFEDGVMVSRCTVDSDYTRYGIYYTSSSSRYANGGGSSVASSPVFTYTLNEDGNAVITGYSGNASALSIPSEIDGYTVVEIGSKAFKGKTGLTSVTIPASATTISSNAFADCSGLKDILIPNGVTTIGNHALQNCYGLRVVHLPDSLTVLGVGAFRNCTALQKVYIPKDMNTSEHAGNSAYPGPFYNCTNLTDIVFEEGITNLPAALFEKCGLTKIVLPDTITTIGRQTFAECYNLKDVTLPKNLLTISGSSFSDCTALTEIAFPNSLELLGSYAFQNCYGLSVVHLPDSLTVLGVGAFQNCTALQKVYIPKDMNTGEHAGNSAYPGPFYNCTNLTDIVFEEGITSLPAALFEKCGLTKIVLPDTITTIGWQTFAECYNLKDVTLPKNLLTISGYSFSDCTALTEIVLPNSLELLGNGTFQNCTNLQKVYIPKRLNTEDYAGNSGRPGPFTGCSSLKDISFEEGISYLPAALFQNCSGLVNIKLPETLKDIRWVAFQGCVNLESIIIPESVTNLEASVFSGCTKLKSVQWNSTYTKIPEKTFYECTSLTDFQIPAQIDTIGSQAFYNCDSLDKIIIPQGVLSLGGECFRDCNSLEQVTLPDAMTSLGKSCFQNCDSIEIIVFPATLKTLGEACFYDCDNIIEIVMPHTVSELGKQCFYSCDQLKKVTISQNITTIPANCFQQCSALEEVTIPRGVTTLGDYAFNSCTSLTKIVIPREVTTISTTTFSYPDRMTICGVPGTYAETYANENDFPFVASTESATSATLNTKQLTLNKGASETLVLTVTPETYTDAVTWKSSDTSIVTVSNRGVVKAIAVGTATIKVNVGSKSASCKVTVVQPVTKISLNRTSLSMDALQTFSLMASVSPNNAHNKTVVWSSSNEEVATVDENGLVTALKKGNATIVAMAQDGSGVTQRCTVTVNNSAHIVNRLSQFESPHNYPDNCTDFWVFTVAGEEKLQVTFDARTNIEEDFDFLKIFDGSGNLIGEYTGTILAGQTVEVPGDTVRIQLISDEGGNEWGFKVTDLGVDVSNTVVGSCGTSALWEFDFDTGELIVFGTGVSENYTSAENTPWYAFRDNIQTVVVGDRITAIGNHAFDGCSNLTTVFLPTSITSIGNHAFANCGTLKTVEYVGAKTAWDKIETGTGNSALSNIVSYNAAKQKSVKEIQVDTVKKTLKIKINRCANTFEQLIVGIYEQNGKMATALLIAYDGSAEAVTIELPQRYKHGYIIKTFFTNSAFIPMYCAQTHSHV